VENWEIEGIREIGEIREIMRITKSGISLIPLYLYSIYFPYTFIPVFPLYHNRNSYIIVKRLESINNE